MLQKDCFEPSRDRKGAGFRISDGPRPHGRGSDRPTLLAFGTDASTFPLPVR